MTDRIQIELFNPQQAMQELSAGRAWQWVKSMLVSGHRLHVEIRKSTRSTASNRLMWSCLRDISRQIEWPVDGRMQKLSEEEWKTILSAGLSKHERVAQGVEGGWVMLGRPTSKLTQREMNDLITLMHAFGDERGVNWSQTSLGREWEIAA